MKINMDLSSTAGPKAARNTVKRPISFQTTLGMVPVTDKCAFKKTDVRRAAIAAKEAGIEIARIEISKAGTISVVAGKPTPTEQTELDKWIDTHNADDT